MQVGSEIRQWTPNMAVLAPPNGKTVHAAYNLSPDKIQYWFYFGRLNFPNQGQPASPRPPAAPQAAGAPPRGPNPFIAQAVARSTVAGKPLSSLPADAYHW
jgi:hypothetical protein